MQETIHIFSEQLSIHNKTKNKKSTKWKTMNSQISCLKIHFLKPLVFQLITLHSHNTYHFDILNKTMILGLENSLWEYD